MSLSNNLTILRRNLGAAGAILVLTGTMLTGQGMAGPLHDAAKAGDLAKIESLIAEGADLSEVLLPFGTPLHWAINGGRTEAAKALLEAGADPDADFKLAGMSLAPLQVAASNGYLDFARLLLEAGADPNYQSAPDDTTPLHLAAKYNHAELVALLLEHGADVTRIGTEYGSTPLQEAAVYNAPESAELLISAGASLDIADANDFSTPLHLTAEFGSLDVARVLVEAGCDLSAKTKLGRTALATARWAKHEDVVAYLESVGAPE